MTATLIAAGVLLALILNLALVALADRIAGALDRIAGELTIANNLDAERGTATATTLRQVAARIPTQEDPTR